MKTIVAGEEPNIIIASKIELEDVNKIIVTDKENKNQAFVVFNKDYGYYLLYRAGITSDYYLTLDSLITRFKDKYTFNLI